MASDSAARFTEEDLSCDAFLDGRLQVWQPRRGYRAAMDPVLLAATVCARPGDRVLELGCGVGVASLCLAARIPGLRLVGVELQAAYAALAERNAVQNGVDLTVFCADLAALPAEVLGQSFDHAIANPPYYPTGGGTASSEPSREMALREATALGEWVGAARRRLRPGGVLTVIQAADRLPDLLAHLWQGMGSIVVLPVTSRNGQSARRVIVRARKGGRAPFRLAASLILHTDTGLAGDGYTIAARGILREGAAFDF